MTQVELFNLLKAIGYPVAYNEFEEPPSIPFITYLYTSERYRGSDFQNNIVERDVRIELYTEYKDIAAEKKLEQLLSITAFTKSKSKISDEKLRMIVYEFDTIEKN